MTAAVAVQSDPGAAPVPRPARLKLYEAGAELEAAFELLAETEGELTPEIEELLAEAEGNFDEKAERVALVVREFLATEAAEKAQAEAISQVAVAPHQKRAAAAKRAAESLKAYLVRELTKAGGSEDPANARKVATKRVKIRLQKNSRPSFKIAVVETWNYLASLWSSPGGEAIVEKTVDYKLKDAALLERHKSGAELPPEIKVEQGYHVRID